MFTHAYQKYLYDLAQLEVPIKPELLYEIARFLASVPSPKKLAISMDTTTPFGTGVVLTYTPWRYFWFVDADKARTEAEAHLKAAFPESEGYVHTTSMSGNVIDRIDVLFNGTFATRCEVEWVY